MHSPTSSTGSGAGIGWEDEEEALAALELLVVTGMIFDLVC